MHRTSARRPSRLPRAGRAVLISRQGTGPGGLSGGTDSLSGHHFQRAAIGGWSGHQADGRAPFNAEFPAGVRADRGCRTPWYPSDG